MRKFLTSSQLPVYWPIKSVQGTNKGNFNWSMEKTIGQGIFKELCSVLWATFVNTSYFKRVGSFLCSLYVPWEVFFKEVFCNISLHMERNDNPEVPPCGTDSRFTHERQNKREARVVAPLAFTWKGKKNKGCPFSLTNCIADRNILNQNSTPCLCEIWVHSSLIGVWNRNVCNPSPSYTLLEDR